MVREAEAEKEPKRTISLRYEPEVYALTVYLQDPETPLTYSNEAQPGVILNYAQDRSLASIEVLDASKHYAPGQLAAHSVDEFIDLRKASELSGIARVTLRTQAERGRLWALRLGGQWVTTRDRLHQYLDSRYRRSAP